MYYIFRECDINSRTHSAFAHSYPAGQSSAPVCSWWNPRPILTFLGIWEVSVWPLGVIQSIIAAFILFVLSALEPPAPFWIYWSDQIVTDSSTKILTNSIMDITSSLDEDMRRPSRLGTIFSSSRNTAYLFLSLAQVSPTWIAGKVMEYVLLSECLQSSLLQLCHDGYTIRQQRLDIAKGVHNKWRPWCINGSCMVL